MTKTRTLTLAPGAPAAKFQAASQALDALIEAEGYKPEPPGPQWTDPEIATVLRRYAAFTRRGMTHKEAETLAESMLLRDRPDSGDDRRICLECRQFSGIDCEAGILVPRTLLQRCPAFELRGESPLLAARMKEAA